MATVLGQSRLPTPLAEPTPGIPAGSPSRDDGSAADATELTEAARAVDRWWGSGPMPEALGEEIEALARTFPFEPVLGLWHRQGRAAADPGTARLVDLVHRALVTYAPGDPGSFAWFLESWLPMLTDIGRGECTYGTYVGTHVLHDLTIPDEPEAIAAPYDTETVIGVLLALLLKFETDHAAERPVSHRRLSVIASALVQHRGVLLDRQEAGALWPPARLAGAKSGNEAIVEAAARLAEATLQAAPETLTRFLGALVVPVTTEYDEVMFLRTLQLFETVFEAILRRVLAARSLLAGGGGATNVDAATEQLAAAGSELNRAIPFFRIVGTMPADRFALIRTATTGASGLQSEAFKRIELASARLTDERLGSDGYTEPNVAAFVPEVTREPSIEEQVVELLDASPGRAPTRLLGAMTVLDRAWLQWKKTHWAIATRLIGQVAGTGGTEGAIYLRRHMASPLFPLLHT